MQSQKPPKNCREAFTADGDQVFAGRYYSSENTRPKFLSKDVDSEIRLVSVQALLWYSDCSLWYSVCALQCASFHITLATVISGKDCEYFRASKII